MFSFTFSSTTERTKKGIMYTHFIYMSPMQEIAGIN